MYVRTRRLYANLNQALAWDRPLALAPDALKELEFWENCFEKFEQWSAHLDSEPNLLSNIIF